MNHFHALDAGREAQIPENPLQLCHAENTADERTRHITRKVCFVNFNL